MQGKSLESIKSSINVARGDSQKQPQLLGPVVHWINRYPVDSVVCFVNIYPLDNYLFRG